MHFRFFVDEKFYTLISRLKFSFILSYGNSTVTLNLPLCTGRASFFFSVLAADVGEYYYFLTEAEGLLLNCGTVFRINI